MSDEQPPIPEEGATKLTFDQAICLRFRETIHHAFVAHPELRSVAVVFDYAGSLNDARVDKAIWLGPDGAVQSLAGVFGSIQNTLSLLDAQMTRAAAAEQQMRERVSILGAEAKSKHEELQKLERKKAALEAEIERLRPSKESGSAESQAGG